MPAESAGQLPGRGVVAAYPLPDSHFELIYSCSVLSHLTEDVANSWLAEIGRLLKPSGVAFLSYNGTANTVSYLSTRPDELRKVFQSSLFSGDVNHDLDGIVEGDYYRASFSTDDWWEQTFRKHLHFADIERSAVSGFQDFAVVRKKTESN